MRLIFIIICLSTFAANSQTKMTNTHANCDSIGKMPFKGYYLDKKTDSIYLCRYFRDSIFDITRRYYKIGGRIFKATLIDKEYEVGRFRKCLMYNNHRFRYIAMEKIGNWKIYRGDGSILREINGDNLKYKFIRIYPQIRIMIKNRKFIESPLIQ